MAEQENILTKNGKKDLEDKLNLLINTEKPKALADLNLARSQGDLSENADYDAAREKTQEIETEISRIQYILDHCTVLEDSKKGNTARLGGGAITVKNIATGKEYTFVIVGSAEADPIKEKISNTCPVAQAVLNHTVGETVTVQVAKPYGLLIKKIVD
ncbi:MAG: transcription elongation factor GreA [Bacilli bacterium]|jgi:transcription elongation factor GreA